MEEAELRSYQSESLRHCDKLLNEVKSDLDDIGSFFGGELRKTYVDATDKALSKIQQVRTKIRNL